MKTKILRLEETEIEALKKILMKEERKEREKAKVENPTHRSINLILNQIFFTP